MLFFGESRRYYALDTYLQNTFGQKVYKLALDGGMSCPNRDGTLGPVAVFSAVPAVPEILPPADLCL